VTLRVRWLGTVPYREALAVQESLFAHGRDDHLLLLEHPHVFTYGPRSDLDTNLRCDPAAVGADFVAVSRGGDITYHGPGQLVGYPILSIVNKLGSLGHVRNVEQLVIDTLASFGVDAGRLAEYPCVGRAVGVGPAEDLCHRRTAQGRAHDARLRAQRRDRPDVHA
jgi:lipoic acid synthetase